MIPKDPSLSLSMSQKALGGDYAKCTDILRKFIAKPQFDEHTVLARDSSYPRISIVIPLYNQAKFLERTLLSILNQNYPNLEIIIIDGGSTDGSVDTIKKYKRYITYWVSEPDKGQSDAINKGLNKVTDEWIGWQNSDDLYWPNAFYAAAKTIKEHEDIDLISGVVAWANERDEVQRILKCTKPTFDRVLYDGFVMSSQGVFWRNRSEWRFDINFHYAMDMELWLRILRESKAAFMPRLTGVFRIYQGTKTDNWNEDAHAEIVRIRKQYGKLLTPTFRLRKWALRSVRLLQWYSSINWQVLDNLEDY